jgi:hypothetical protein
MAIEKKCQEKKKWLVERAIKNLFIIEMNLK